MTEDEAKTKWCAMVRFHNGLDGDVYCSHPIGVVTDSAALCIASGCMMWRTTLHGTEGKVYEGYCGLAGKP